MEGIVSTVDCFLLGRNGDHENKRRGAEGGENGAELGWKVLQTGIGAIDPVETPGAVLSGSVLVVVVLLVAES